MEEKKNKISVIVPLYNKKKFIENTINCILAQKFEDFELIVINDGSTDGGAARVTEFSDPRIRLINKNNGGVSSARNLGIERSRGEYVAFLDADDSWLPDYLSEVHSFLLKYPDCGWVTSAYIEKYSDRDVVVRYAETGLLEDALSAMSDSLNIWTGSVVVRRELFTQSCLFPVGIHSGEDTETWLKLACLYPKIGYISKPLSIYNTTTLGSLSKIAVEKNDLGILKIMDRMESFIKELEGERLKLLENYINKKSREKIIEYWINNPNIISKIEKNITRRYFREIEVLLFKNFENYPLQVRRLFAAFLRKISFSFI